jgi:tetratricopeptide (TPR) repeat protein
MRAGFRRVPQARWKDFARILSTSWGFPGDIDQVLVDPIEDTSKPFHLKYHLHVDRYFAVPSTGANFSPIPPLGVRAVASSIKSNEPIEIGPVGDMDYRIRLEFPANYSVRAPTAVKMVRDYGEYSSSYSLTKGVLEGQRKLIIKLNELPAARRTDYDSFRNLTRGDYQVLTATILTPSGKSADASAKIEGTPSELHRAGVKALQSKDYRSATDLLKRAVDGDTNLKEGWYDLGQAYAGVNNHADAIAAFRKQIRTRSQPQERERRPRDGTQQSGSLKKHSPRTANSLKLFLSINPPTRTSACCWRSFGRCADARMELETAISLPPDDPETKLSLAQVYTRLGEIESAGLA